MPDAKADLEQRVRNVEETRAGALVAMKVFIWIASPLLSAVVALCFWLATWISDVKQHTDAIAELRKARDEQRQEVAHLRDLVIERLPRTGTIGALAREGKVLKVSDQDFTIETDPPLPETMTFKLVPDGQGTDYGSNSVKLRDLKPGMRVRVFESQPGQATHVEKLPPSPASPMPPRGDPSHDRK